MSAPGSSHIANPTAQSAWAPRDCLRTVLLVALLAAGIFASPAIPSRLEDWPALRATVFFQGMAVSHPAAPGDGPLAFLLQPMFGPGNVLAHAVWELVASIVLAAMAVLSFFDADRKRRIGGLLFFFVATLFQREIAVWLAGALVGGMMWRKSSQGWAFVLGAALGLLGLLTFKFWLWGALAIALSVGSRERTRHDVLAALAGWVAVLLTGWTLAHGGPSEFEQFLAGGLDSLVAPPIWQLSAGLLIISAAFVPRFRRTEASALIFTAGCFLAAIPLEKETGGVIADNLRGALSSRLQGWSILIHPERFERRVLQPAWDRLRTECAFPAIAGEVGNEVVDVLGPGQLVAVAHSLRHLPGSRRTLARAVIAPVELDPAGRFKARDYHRLMAQNGYALYVHDLPARAGFAPWRLATGSALTNAPSLVESSGPPLAASKEGVRVASFALPAHLIFGPTPFASKQVVGKYYWDGGPGRVVIRLDQGDGSASLLMERGLNPSVHAEDRGLQSFVLDLPDTTTNWIDVEARPEFAGDATPAFHLVDLEFKRDLSRMMSTTLAPDVLHHGAGFNSMPVIVFSTSEAAPGHGAAGRSMLLVHMPATVAFAKVREATRLTGIFGFLPGAYEKAAGTAGATFNIMWFSGNDGAKQIFSRTLKPHTEPGDRGPQKLDLDLTDLPDGILSFTISPAVAGDISWGWTYLGEIDVRRTEEEPEAERFDEIMDGYRAGLRPLPALLKTTEQKPQLVECGDGQLLRVHAPGEAIFGVTSGHTRASGKFGFADEAWSGSGRTDGADFIVLWRDHHGDVELFRQHLQPNTNPADRGIHEFSVDLGGRGNGLLVLKTDPGPAHNNYWDWTGWSDLIVQ